MSTHVARFDPRKATSISNRGSKAASTSKSNDGTAANFTNASNHGEELTLPLRYRDLSRDASIYFRVYAPSTERAEGGLRQPGGARLVATATLSLFDNTGKLRTSLQKLRLDMVPPIAGTSGKYIRNAGREGEEEDPLWEASKVLEGIRQTVAREEVGKRPRQDLLH